MKLFLIVLFCLMFFATGHATDTKKTKVDVEDKVVVDEYQYLAVSKGAKAVSEATLKKGSAPVGSTLLGSFAVCALGGRIQ